MKRVALVLLAGCLHPPDFAGPGDAAPPGDALADGGSAAFDRCTAGDSDALRYAVLAAPSAPWTWSDARTACIRFGMDLAVMNEASELGHVDPDVLPAWIGETDAGSADWLGIDQCALASPPAPRGDLCASVTAPGAVSGTACDTSANVIFALCETPHATSQSCAREPQTETYSVSPAPLAYADAVTFCAGQSAHLVVIDSAQELGYVAGLVPTVAAQAFWFGEHWNGSAWQSATACPGEFSWADEGSATARLADAATCASAVLQPTPGGDPDAPPVLALAGQELSPCDAMKLALCERE